MPTVKIECLFPTVTFTDMDFFHSMLATGIWPWFWVACTKRLIPMKIVSRTTNIKLKWDCLKFVLLIIYILTFCTVRILPQNSIVLYFTLYRTGQLTITHTKKPAKINCVISVLFYSMTMILRHIREVLLTLWSRRSYK